MRRKVKKQFLGKWSQKNKWKYVQSHYCTVTVKRWEAVIKAMRLESEALQWNEKWLTEMDREDIGEVA